MTLQLLFFNVMALILPCSSCQCFLTEAKVFLSTRYLYLTGLCLSLMLVAKLHLQILKTRPFVCLFVFLSFEIFILGRPQDSLYFRNLL